MILDTKQFKKKKKIIILEGKKIYFTSYLMLSYVKKKLLYL